MRTKIASLIFFIALCGLYMIGCSGSDSSDSGTNVIVEVTAVTSSSLINWGRKLTDKYEAAQSFRVSADDACSSVELLLGAHNGSPSGEYIVQLQTGNANSPSGTLVLSQASGSKNIVSLYQNTWSRWYFDVPIPLSAGQTYWIVCKTTETTSDSYVNLTGNAADSYPDGHPIFSINGAPWTNIINVDICFRLLR